MHQSVHFSNLKRIGNIIQTVSITAKLMIDLRGLALPALIFSNKTKIITKK